MKNVTKLQSNNVTATKSSSKFQAVVKHFKRDWQLTLMFLPCILFYITFRYGPMYGLLIAFKKYSPYKGILGSNWVGLKYFQQFFASPDFFLLFKNTLSLGLLTLIWTFPFPIIFAILLSEIRTNRLKKTVQTVTYLPAFLSTVVVCSMLIDMVSPSRGLVNNIIAAFGFEKIYFMIEPKWFRTVYIVSDIWQNMGYGAVIYLAAIAGIDPSLYEAGHIDGCNRLKSMIHITLPSIFPTIATMFIIKSGGVIRVGFEKVLLLYGPTTYEVADVFSTYVYRKGLLEMNYSFGSAVGLFESIIALIFVIIANTVSKKLSETSLW